MIDPFARQDGPAMEIHAPMKLKGTIAGLFKAEGRNYVTSPVDELELDFDGIPGDYHAGPTRKSGPREPWYPRGTVMRNERQVSLLAPDELQTIARRLDIPELKSEWIGGNLLLEGIPNFSMLPPRTLLFFEGGVTIRIDGDNDPCRDSGRSIVANNLGRDDIELGFPKAAMHLRGLVGWIEKPGSVKVGESFEARIWRQHIYSPT